MIKIDTSDVSVTDVCEAVTIKQDRSVTVILKMPEQIFNLVRIWQERAITRSSLRDLDARLLEDVGLSRKQADNEADKPFWV